MKNSSDTMKVIGALVIGAAAGATLGVLFAPKKGSKTREKIADSAKKMTKNLKQKFQGDFKDLKKQAIKAEKKLEDKAGSFKNAVENKATDAKNNLDHKMGNVIDAVKS